MQASPIWGAPTGTADLALLPQIPVVQVSNEDGALLRAHPGAVRWLTARPHLIEALSASTRRAVDLAADPLLEQPHVEPAASP